LPLLLAGCIGDAMQQAQKAAQRQNLSNELKQMGIARFNFHDANNRFPNSWQELQSVGVDPGLQQKLEAEGHTVVMGMSVREMTEGTSRFLVVFQRSAAQNGGLVLLGDGAVMQISPQEFNEFWTAQQPTMANATVIEPSAVSASAPAAGGGSAPPPPPGGGSAPPPPPGK
jgi:hypothetical protein